MLKFKQWFFGYNRKVLLCSVSWFLGLLFGLLISLEIDISFDDLSKSVSSSNLSIIGFLTVLVFPYLLSAILLKFSVWWGICFQAFGKAFAYSCCSAVIVRCSDCAGWLLKNVLFFSSSTTVVFLLWFWIRSCRQVTTIRHRDMLLCMFLSLVVGFIDYSIISPFGVRLLSYS